MKISNSKKQLAKIISENGGWREGNYAVQDKDDKKVWFMFQTVGKPSGRKFWPGVKSRGILCNKVLPHWHQTILSRDEYFHLYPAPDAAAEETEHVWTNPPTIEQLAAEYRNRLDYAERKQQEADEAKAEAETKLAELVAAGKAVGLVLSVAAPEPELVITDWRDLQVGDIIECIGNWENEATDGRRFAVTKLDPVFSQGFKPIRIEVPGVSCPGTWGIDFKFIRRPTKEADNA